MKDTNTIFNSGLDSSLDSRFCVHCHTKLMHHNNEKYVYKCITCGVVTGIQSTEPTERLVTTFPSSQQNNNQPVEINKRFIYQATDQRLPRDKLFQNKRYQELNKSQINDPYLRELKKRTDITITDLDYYDPTTES